MTADGGADGCKCDGADAMPVEITDFCWKYNLQRLQNLPEVKGCEAKLRHNADGTPYVDGQQELHRRFVFQNAHQGVPRHVYGHLDLGYSDDPTSDR